MRGTAGSAGGPGGAGGYNFQARATAFACAHVLAERRLAWVRGASPVPLAVEAETGGPGDDLRIECDGGIVVEAQAKSGLRRTEELWRAILDLVRGLVEDPMLYGVLLVDHAASRTIKRDLREDVERLARGQEGLKDITVELKKRLGEAGVEDLSVLKRFAVEVRDFHDRAEGHENAVLMLSAITDAPEAAWGVLVSEGHTLMENRGKRDAEDLVGLLSNNGITLLPRPGDKEPLARALRLLEELPLEEVPDRAALPPGSVMPLRANRHFVGRREQLKRIATNLKAGDATTISAVTVAASSGLGGVGKTQLASEFVHRYGQFFHGVYWLSFAEPGNVPSEVASCGGTGGMNLRPNFHTLPLKERVQAVVSEWQSELPRLLVFDNCEDEDLLDRWLPPTGGCRVLVTSRRGNWDPALGVMGLPLDVLDRQDSVALLREYRSYPNADDPHLHAVAEELGDLPLALDLAGRYLSKYRREVTPAAYLEEIRRPELLEHPSLREARGISPTRHEMDVWRTFALSYWRLDADDETDGQAIKLLARAARLTPGEPMPGELLALSLNPHGHPGVVSSLPATLARDALQRLTEVGLLGEEADGVYGMHRLVAAFVLAEVGDDGAQAAAEAACSRAALEAVEEGNPGRQELLVPHVQPLADAAMSRVDEAAADICAAAGVALVQLGAHDRALPYAQRAVDITANLHGPNDRRTLQRRSNVGMLLKSKGERDAARAVYEEVLRAQEDHLGRDDPDVAATINNMGVLLWGQDLYHEMLPLYRRALRIRERVWEGTDPDDPSRRENAYEAAEGHSNMGALMMDLGRPRQAGPHLDSALRIMVGEFGEDHQRNARTLVMRGAALRALGLHLEAATGVRRALDIYRGVTRTAPPAVGAALANLGSILAELAEEDGVYEEQRAQLREMAGGFLQAALTGSELGYGEEHPVTGGLHRALGAVRDAQGATEDARVHQQRAEACRRLNLGGADANAAVSINAAGRSLTEWGLYDEAQVYLERALDVREDVLGERNFDTSTSLLNLGVLLQLRGRDALARPYLQRALAARSDVCGEDHPATEVVRDNLRLLES